MLKFLLYASISWTGLQYFECQVLYQKTIIWTFLSVIDNCHCPMVLIFFFFFQTVYFGLVKNYPDELRGLLRKVTLYKSNI